MFRMKINHKRAFIYFSFVILAGIVMFIFLRQTSVSNVKVNDEVFHALRERKYAIFSLPLPDTLTFAGEPVPIDNIFVREALEREVLAIAYWHSRTLLILKRSYRYFPLFLEIFQQYGIPEDFCFLAMAESELDFTVSPAGAAGIWQLMKETARSLGLEVTDEVDERFHVEKSTHAACQYLLKLYRQFGSWTMAAAAYNMGPSRLPAIIREQRSNSYYDLVLPIETMRYIYRILAFKLIWQSPRKYGFYLRYKDLYPPIPVDYVAVDTTIESLPAFAQQMNLSYLNLKRLNPWLRQDRLTNKSKQKYLIAIPKTLRVQQLMTDITSSCSLMNDTLQIH